MRQTEALASVIFFAQHPKYLGREFNYGRYFSDNFNHGHCLSHNFLLATALPMVARNHWTSSPDEHSF